jgi:chromosomal replication initiation ATPase DnaA
MGGISEQPIVQDWHAFTARRVVGNEFGVAEQDMVKATRAKAHIAFARQVAMYLAHVVYSMSYNEVAAAFGRERSTVAHACAVVEDARDDPDFERRMLKIERRLQHLAELRGGGPSRPGGRLAAILHAPG